MTDIYILAIESSCDETSVSIIKNGNEDIATSINTQIDIHKKYGGVVPEIASREHLKNIIFVLDSCLKKSGLSMDDISAIAVTYGPGLIGSLMVGVETAKTLSFIYNKPLIAVNHMIGHIYSNNINSNISLPSLILTISGGHTDLIMMNGPLNFTLISSTLDDALGECYDKVARLIGLEYPGGPKLDKLSKTGEDTYVLPLPLNDGSLNFSFSGLKSHIMNLVKREEINPANLAKSFQRTIEEILYIKLNKALDLYPVKSLLICGGVSANEGIRNMAERLAKERGIKVSFPEKKYSTDNAAMIGSAAYYYYLNQDFSDLSLYPKSSLELNNK